MTKDEHRKRHIELHQALDELCADWMAHQPLDASKLVSNTSIMELMQWSARQTEQPEEICSPNPTTTSTGEKPE